MKNLIALLLFLGGFSLWKFYSDQQEMTDGLASANEHLVALEKSLAPRRDEVRAYAEAAALKTQIASTKAEITKLQTEAQSNQRESARLLEESLSLIAKARQAWQGRVLSNLVLKDGRSLGNARILRLEETSLSLATGAGVAKISPALLPDPIRQALHYQP